MEDHLNTRHYTNQANLRLRPWLIFCIVLATSSILAADEQSDNQLNDQFSSQVLPFLKTHCLSCHGREKQEGKFDLSSATSVAAIVDSQAAWEIVLQRIESNEMPPEDAEKQPAAEDREAVVKWIRAIRNREANRHADDPGIVLARRLSNAEFDNTIRDLTGVDIRPTKEFPVDPANAAGFDNSGESLTMSPALLKKYLLATRQIADHAVLTPRGLLFAPHPVISETDRDKFCVQRIISFYDRHRVHYEEYFLAAWKFQQQSNVNSISTEDELALKLREHAVHAGLSVRYLSLLWKTLHQPEDRGPIHELQTEWAKLPKELKRIDEARSQCQRLSKLVAKMRAEFQSTVKQIEIKGNSRGSQPLILWWNRQIAAARMSFAGDGIDAELDAARHRFCAVFPDTFSVSSRGHYSDGDLGAGVRLLSAGFHLMQGYFRDDQPLYELVLDDAQRQVLDEFWQDLNFVTYAPLRQYKDFLFFERAEPPRFAGGPEFDFARPEDKDSTSEAKLLRMREVYLNKVRAAQASEQATEAVQTYFDTIDSEIRWIEKSHIDAEPRHLDDFLKLADRAWRRPLSVYERQEWLSFYRQLRDVEGLSHEDAIRDCIVSLLMSPHFSYRFDLANTTEKAKSTDEVPVEISTEMATRPLTDYELASRLSYFLWSSMPDEELLSHAATGELHQPTLLVAQARRMMQDPKIRGLSTEFLGNWLEFRRFEEHNGVDRARFPTFDNALRSAMFEEPLRFFMDLVQRDGSILDLLTADHTFVNRPLAAHYEMKSETAISESVDDWVRIDGAAVFGRGGLLPMSVFLTQNSPGLRTSPVKRGYWVVRRLLGEHIPAPPPNVPELPKDEAQSGDRTLAEHLAVHRNNVACAGCHQKFDSFGLIFESFGPIGEHRALDLGGHPVQTQATFPDGTHGNTIEDLRHYLVHQRRNDFVDNFVQRMFAFALGRGTLLSDTPVIKSSQAKLQTSEFRIATLIEAIVTSPQFMNRRER